MGLPACQYGEMLTAHRDYAEWAITLLDTTYHVGGDYAPTDLVDSSTAGVNAGYAIRSILVEDLSAMADAARTAGVPIQLVSGYRNHAQQQQTFDYWVSVGALPSDKATVLIKKYGTNGTHLSQQREALERLKRKPIATIA